MTESFYEWSEKTILIVEDDIYNSKLLMRTLSATKANCLIAENGMSAIDLYKKSPKIDIVLMDIQLPDINGYDVTKKIIEINPDAKVIAQTAYASLEDKDKCLHAGCCDFIIKPIEKDVFLSTINKFI